MCFCVQHFGDYTCRSVYVVFRIRVGICTK